MSIDNLREYSDNYFKTYGILQEFYKNVLALDRNGAIVNFTENDAITNSFNFKEKITAQRGSNGTKMLR